MGQLGTPCENGGNCTDAFNDYVCDCVTGWIGDECQADINECAVADPLGDFNPCENGGICLDQVGSYECDCFNTGYEGDLCDVDIDECLLFPCQNGGEPAKRVCFH
jgi:Notch-like protein